MIVVTIKVHKRKVFEFYLSYFLNVCNFHIRYSQVGVIFKFRKSQVCRENFRYPKVCRRQKKFGNHWVREKGPKKAIKGQNLNSVRFIRSGMDQTPNPMFKISIA